MADTGGPNTVAAAGGQVFERHPAALGQADQVFHRRCGAFGHLPLRHRAAGDAQLAGKGFLGQLGEAAGFAYSFVQLAHTAPLEGRQGREI